MSLLNSVRRFAHQQQLWQPSSRVLAAVSGGSDSVALLFLLKELAASGDLTLAGLAHLEHGIRGGESREDAGYCRALAERLEMPSVIGSEDVPAFAEREGLSIEVAARELRYRFLSEAAAAVGADVIALAHTVNDQAETVLMRLVRGAGPAGLSGMASRRGMFIRPLLEVTREELRAYLSSQNETWREDGSNEDRANPRNRMRHDILPLLREHFNPRVDQALSRTADIVREDESLLEELTAEAAARLMSHEDGRVLLEREALRSLPAALARRVALGALETANPGRTYGLEEAEIVRAVAQGASAADVAGVRLERSGGFVVIEERSRDRGQTAGFELPLDVPGTVTAPRGEWEVGAEGPIPWPSGQGPQDRSHVMIDAALLSGSMTVRSRRPGDRLRPLGMTGRKKVQDVLVDRKVPRDARDEVPIVVDASGEIVWVAGHALAERYRVTPRTTAVVMLTLRRKNARRTQ